MKRITYSFLLLFVLSCGTPQASDRNRVTVQFRDSVIKEYYLISVRYNTLVISPYSDGPHSMRSLQAAMEIVPFEKVEKVVIKGDRYVGSILGSGLLGLGLGGCLAWHPQCNSYNSCSSNLTPEQDRLVLSVGAAGFVAGMILGGYLSYTDKEFLPSERADMNSLRNFHAIYSNGEPPELQRIK